MTITEAAAHVGDTVTYAPHPGATPEDGTIVAVNDRYAMVRYGRSIKATRPEDLQLKDPTP